MPLIRIYCLFFLLLPAACLCQLPKLVLPEAHIREVNKAKFSKDGTKILTMSMDAVKLWDAKSGLVVADLVSVDDASYVTDADFSPDGKKVITVYHFITKESDTRIWDSNTGEILFTLKTKTAITKAIFSPDGKKIITANDDHVCEIWNSENGKLIRSLPGHVKQVSAIAVDLSGKKFITASYDKTARVYDVVTGELLFILQGHENELWNAGFSPDGKTIVTTSKDKTAKLWDAITGQLLFTLTGHTFGLACFSFSPDGTKLVTATAVDKIARLWDVGTGKLISTSDKHGSGVYSICFSPDGKKIYAGNTGLLYLRIWDPIRGIMIDSLKSLNTRTVYAISFSEDGTKFLTGMGDGTAKIWDTKTGSLLLDLKGGVARLLRGVFNPRGGQIVTTGTGLPGIWNSETASFQTRLKITSTRLLRGDYLCACYTPDGKKIVTGTKYGYVVTFDAGTGIELHSFQAHRRAVVSVDVKSDGKQLLTASVDSLAKVWNIETDELIAVLKGHKNELLRARFSPGQWTITTVSKDSTVRIWDALSFDRRETMTDHHHFVLDVNYSPDGQKIVTSSYDRTARIWDVASGTCLQTIKIKNAAANSVQFSPDGTKVVTAGSDRLCKVWNAETGAEIATLKGHKFEIISAAFSPDGRRIVTVALDKSGKVWNANTYKLLYTFYSIVPKNDFIILVPGGYFQATPDAARLVHYVTPDLRVLTFEQLDLKYNRPDKVLEAIGSTDTALIRAYRKAYEKRVHKLGIDTTAFQENYSIPDAEFADRDKIAYDQENGTLSLHIKASDNTFKLTSFNVWINECPVFGQQGVDIKKLNKRTLDRILTVKLSQGQNRIETSVTNQNGTESYRMPLFVNYTPAVKQKETTYFIGIGVDQFADSRYNLAFSTKDIRDLAKKLQEKYSSNIVIDTLFNERVTIANVKALKQRLQQTTENDKVIVAYSGHGMLSRDLDYYLSTYNINFENPAENGLSYDDLENLLDSIPARKKLMLIDACHSGEVDKEELMAIDASASFGLQKGLKPVGEIRERRLGSKSISELMQALFVNVAKSTGATIIGASAGTQFALERNDLRNGVFTFSILEAMKRYPTMKLGELRRIVGERVEELTNGLQKPTSRNEALTTDWSVW